MSDRFEDEQYLNWLKLSLALVYTKEALESFTSREVSNFHALLQSSFPHPPGLSLTAHTLCCVCLKSQIKKDWFRGTFTCTTSVCDRWIHAILQYHVFPRPRVEWENVDISQLPVSPWDCVKLFMPFGYQSASKVEDFDLAAMLSLYLNCRHFHNFFTGTIICEQIKEVRNRLMHSGQMRLGTAQLLSDVAKIRCLLQDPKHLKDDAHCQAAIGKIDKLMTENLEISLTKELELRVLNLTVRELEDKVCQLQNKSDIMTDAMQAVRDDVEAGNQSVMEEISSVRQEIVQGRNKKTKPRQQSSEESSDKSSSSSDSDQAESRRTRKKYTNSRGGTTIVTKTFNNYGGNITNIKNVDSLVLNVGQSRPRNQAKQTADPKPANTTNPSTCSSFKLSTEYKPEFFGSYHTHETIKEISQPVQTSPFSNPVGFSSPVLNNFDDVDTVMKVLRMAGSVCKLLYPGGFGTGIRVGRNKVMITCHSLYRMLGFHQQDFARRNCSMFEPLRQPRVHALFNYDTNFADPVKFYFDGEVQFLDPEETDIAVLSLLPNSDGVPFPEPFKYFSLPNSEFIFIGHPQGETKKMESVKKIVHLNDRTKMEILELPQWSLDTFNRPYDEPQMVDSVHRLLFHSSMINGASGSPGLVLVDGENVAVVTIFIHKFPDWLYDPDVAPADKDKVPEAYRISQGVNMYSVYDLMRTRHPELCEEIFHSWNGQ